MYKIDDLITEIYTDETIELPETLTRAQQRKIENDVLGKMRQTKKFPRQKRYIILLAATLLLALGLTVTAAKENEWDITLINFMGLNASDVLQLDDGEVVINETSTSTCTDYANNFAGEEKQVSITGITSIGDKNSAYLRVNTDYKLPENFDETADYILPENTSIDIIYKDMWGNSELRTFGSTFQSVYEDGKLGFLVSIENCEDINKCNVTLKIENLYWYHALEKDEDLLCDGTWEIDWTYSYKANVRTRRMLKRIDTKEGEVFLTKIEISPISLRMEIVRNPKDRKKQWKMEMLEEIQYKDGTKIETEGTSSCSIGNGMFIESFTNAQYLGEVLKPEEVKCVKVCGKNVEM